MIEDKVAKNALRAQELADMKHLMSDPVNRRVMWKFLTKGNIFRKTFTGNSSSFYLDGKRELTLEVYQDIMLACPELFWKAQQENFKPEDFSQAERN